MSNTFCGKNCEECTYKEELNCPGCKEGPGHEWNGSCSIARCCDNRGHDCCETCNQHDLCGTLRRKNEIPKERISEQTAEAEKNKRIAQKASVLGKWMPILFWVSIASIIAGIFASDELKGFNILYLTGSIAESVCGIISVIALFKMSPTSQRYKAAAWGRLIAVVITFLTVLFVIITVEPVLALLAIVAAVVMLYSQYSQLKGHSEVLEEADPDLSEKWDKLIKWYIICYIVLIASIVLAIIPIIALLAILVSSVGLLIIGIAELVLLYHTKNVFQFISKQ